MNKITNSALGIILGIIFFLFSFLFMYFYGDGIAPSPLEYWYQALSLITGFIGFIMLAVGLISYFDTRKYY